eukprot:7385759-Prymnesium_polylepis.1
MPTRRGTCGRPHVGRDPSKGQGETPRALAPIPYGIPGRARKQDPKSQIGEHDRRAVHSTVPPAPHCAVTGVATVHTYQPPRERRAPKYSSRGGRCHHSPHVYQPPRERRA